jgi:drug/metabolite transporter (DMT)-like permease
VALVLFSAPPGGDASTLGNVFGVIAMVLWTGYVTSTRHFRNDMDVATFMATVSPIAAVAVLPLAIANGDVVGMSRTGWIYTLVLALLIGIGGHGLMVFAQTTIPIGTIGIVQVVQPALAVVWSFLLLGEQVNHRQVIGIAVVITGLLVFVLMNRNVERGGRAEQPVPPSAWSPTTGHRSGRRR